MKYEETIIKSQKVIDSCKSQEQLKYAKIYCRALIENYTKAIDLKYWMFREVDLYLCDKETRLLKNWGSIAIDKTRRV